MGTSNLGAIKSTSFHSVALHCIYVIILFVCHFLIPYINELVFSFFNGFFLIISILLFFILNAAFRASSITSFSYFSLFFRNLISIIIFSFLIICIAFITNTTEIIERTQFLKFLTFLFLLTIFSAFLTKYIYILLKPRSKPSLVLMVDDLNEANLKNRNFKFPEEAVVTNFHIDAIDDVVNFSAENGVEGVYLSVTAQNLNSIEILANKLSIYAFDLYWILPNSFFRDQDNLILTKPILLNGSPVYLDTSQYLLKRTLDVIGSIFLLVIMSPIIIIVSALIKIADNGPIFYSQLRHGQYGKEFSMLKFRSMAEGSDHTDKQVTDQDSRVTWVGKIMRKTSFDEIPQLFNVLRGEMSLVGPRPHIISETDRYSRKIIHFLSRHQVKPGLTGLAQIRARGKTNSTELMQEKLDSDLEYINQWKLYLDLKILILTPLSIWNNRHNNV